MHFDSFVGNTKIIERLRAKLKQERFPHGLIFSGPEGVGKHTCALMLAKALNCTNAQPGDFCNECSSCRKIEAGTHPDVTTITVEEEATQIKIAQIRQFLAHLELHPLEGRNKIFIIDPANLLSAEAANALLKGLEEPPENSFLILVTVNVHELLLTVRSRCQVYNFTPLALDEIRGHSVTDELAVRWCQGSIGRARALDIPRLKKEREIVMDFLEVVITATQDQFQDLLSTSAELGRAKVEFESRMAILAVLIADLLYVKEGVPHKLVNIDLKDHLEKIASRASVERLLKMAEFLRFIESSLKTHVNRQMLTDALAITGNETTATWLA
jgi:DNA polymerase III subunit delta'